MDNPQFILAGNNTYENRGNEAIVRGTVDILQKKYPEAMFQLYTFYKDHTQFLKQKKEEYDPRITHKEIRVVNKRFDFTWWVQNISKVICPTLRKTYFYKGMSPSLYSGKAVLSIGGDNYSLDYGIPFLYTDLDDFVIGKNKPIIIWGASVGPFDANRDYERFMIKHLEKITAIFARETKTIEYLNSKGLIENVYQVADPAFVMKPRKPDPSKMDIDIDNSSIGLNLSPLLKNYVADGDINKWIMVARKLILAIYNEFKRPILLIPHVTISNSNDYIFMKSVLQFDDNLNEDIRIIPPTFDAAETKWIISQLSCFVGARTHSTIAALSSYVPTISLSYSIKSKGINKDIFNTDSYCATPEEIINNVLIEKIAGMINNDKEIKKELETKIPHMQYLAFRAGDYLSDVIGDSEA